MVPSDVIRELDPDLVGDMIRQHLNGTYHARARMLQLLVREPELSTRELASRIDRSPSTVRHYLALLRNKGLQGLIGERPNASRLSYRQREVLAAEVHSRRFRSIAEIRDWVADHFAVEYSIPGIRKILKDELGLDRRMVSEHSGSSHAEDSEKSARLVTFLNMLPISTDLTSWIEAFQDAFCQLFPTLAGITVLVNRSSTLGVRERSNVTTSVLEIKVAREQKGRRERRAVKRGQKDIVSIVIERMKEAGKPVEEYYPPIDFIAKIGSADWVGRLLLFFPRSLPDPRPEIEAWLESLRPFLTFCLSDAVTRDLMGSPQHRQFQLAVDRLVYRFRLTGREREVVMLYLSGSSIEEISDDLNISPSTVRNHVYNTHQKTGTRYQRELFNLVLNI